LAGEALLQQVAVDKSQKYVAYALKSKSVPYGYVTPMYLLL